MVTSHINVAPPFTAIWKTVPAGLLRDSSPSNLPPIIIVVLAVTEIVGNAVKERGSKASLRSFSA